MMQQKNEPQKAKKAIKSVKESKTPDLRSQFLALSESDKQAVTHFFNLHNAAIFVFTTLSKAGVEYAELCLKFSQEKGKVEKQ